MLNAATLAAIVAAVWAHPQGVAYLEKIEQIRVCAEAKGNPCCAPHPNLVAYLGGAGKTVQPATKPFSTTYEDVVEQAPARIVINDDEEVVRLVAAMIGELL